MRVALIDYDSGNLHSAEKAFQLAGRDADAEIIVTPDPEVAARADVIITMLPNATAVREVKEETGLDVEVTGLVGVYTNPHHVVAFTDGEVRQQFSLCFTTAVLGGELAIDHESTDIAWIAPDDIPNLDMHPSMRLRIEHYLQHRDRPYLG